MKRSTPFDGVIVNKPWGFERLAYSNGIVSCWILNIRKGESTSLHAHPHKLTGLILLDGVANLNFLNSGRMILPCEKSVIHPHVFHKTQAHSDCIVLEVETPPDKFDLVRLGDSYGREGLPYESPDSYERDPNYSPMDHLNAKKFGQSLVILRKIARAEFFAWVENLPVDSSLVILDGVIATAKGVPVVVPGHIVHTKNFRALLDIARPTGDMEVLAAWKTSTT